MKTGSSGTAMLVSMMVFFSLLFTTATAWADASPRRADNPKRPKICLALSGGGARGAAHVGVIKVLEEYRVPIHCIAGNSMGALVGAAYATGTSISEMEDILSDISTELLFKEKPPHQELSMRRKQDDFNIFFSGLRSDTMTANWAFPKALCPSYSWKRYCAGSPKPRDFNILMICQFLTSPWQRIW